MVVPYVNLIGQHKALKAEILKAVEDVLDRADFIMGKAVVQFEEAFARYCSTQYAIGVNSGTDALFLSLKALDIGPGDEVITVPNSFIATVSAIVATGARPVLVDVEEDSFNIAPSLIEGAMTPQTKAIIPVHLTGRPANMKEIVKIAVHHGVHIIEDAAQAIGAAHRGQRVGTFGILGCFSLHPLKNLSACGDGGVIVTNSEKLYERINVLRKCGLKNRDESPEFGYNSRLDTMQATILNVKFQHIDAWNQKRRENAHYYRENLGDVVMVPQEHEDETAVYHTYVIRAQSRDELKAFLQMQGIETKIHYPIPIHLQEAAGGLGYKVGDFPVTERHTDEILSLPIYPELTAEQMDKVVRAIRNFYQSRISRSL